MTADQLAQSVLDPRPEGTVVVGMTMIVMVMTVIVGVGMIVIVVMTVVIGIRVWAVPVI